MENIMSLLMEIVEYAKFRNDGLETADMIANLDGEDLTTLKDLFEILDEEKEYYDYIYYVAENIDDLLDEIKEYIELRQEDKYENGEDLFEQFESSYDNKYYAEEDDLLEDDWEDIFELEEDLHTEQRGCLMYGTRPSKKKDRSKVVWKPGDLEGDFEDAIEG